MFKKVMVLLLALALVASMVACGDTASTASSETPAASTEAPASTEPAATTEDVQPAEDVATAVDFESGAYDFAKIAYSFAACDLASTMEVGTFNGSKALRVSSPVSDNTFSGSVPFVAVDVVALVGAENVSKIAKIAYEVGIDYGTNNFQAVGGTFAVVNAGVETKSNWTIFMEDENPKVYEVAASELSAEGDTYIYFAVNTDGNPIAASDYTLCIDNIKFIDADGNALTCDESVSFAQVEGIADSFWLNLDWSNACTKPVNETILVAKDGTSPSGLANGNWWPNAAQSWAWAADGVDSYPDMTGIEFKEGMLLTIYYSTQPYADQETYDGHRWACPLVVAQAWTGGGQIQFQLPKDEENPENDRYNESRTIVQYTYEQINEAFIAKGGFDSDGDGNAINDCSFFGISGLGGDGAFEIYKITVGYAE